MADDIVERLRQCWLNETDLRWGYCDYVATLIDNLRADAEQLREALDEYKHRLHWANEELLKRGRP